MPELSRSPVYEAPITVTPSPKIVCAISVADAPRSIGISTPETMLCPTSLKGSANAALHGPTGHPILNDGDARPCLMTRGLPGCGAIVLGDLCPFAELAARKSVLPCLGFFIDCP